MSFEGLLTLGIVVDEEKPSHGVLFKIVSLLGGINLMVTEDEVDNGKRVLDDVLDIAHKDVEHTGIAGSHSSETLIKDLS